MADAASAKRSTETRMEPGWLVRVGPHIGINSPHSNSVSDAVVADVSLGGLRLLTSSPFDADSLIQVEMVRPSRKNPVIGKKAVAVARVVECSKLQNSNGNGNHHPRVNGKRLSHQVRAQFLSLDEEAHDWLKAMIVKHERSSQ